MLNSWLPLVLAISSKSTAEMPLELGTYFDCIYFSLAPIFCKDGRSANKFRKMQIPKFADFIFCGPSADAAIADLLFADHIFLQFEDLHFAKPIIFLRT